MISHLVQDIGKYQKNTLMGYCGGDCVVEEQRRMEKKGVQIIYIDLGVSPGKSASIITGCFATQRDIASNNEV